MTREREFRDIDRLCQQQSQTRRVQGMGLDRQDRRGGSPDGECAGCASTVVDRDVCDPPASGIGDVGMRGIDEDRVTVQKVIEDLMELS